MPSDELIAARVSKLRRDPWLPEMRLLQAVLEEAITCLKKYRAGRSKAYLEAVEWMRSRSRNFVFSFENICDVFDIDADCLRGKLLAHEPGIAKAACRRSGAYGWPLAGDPSATCQGAFQRPATSSRPSAGLPRMAATPATRNGRPAGGRLGASSPSNRPLVPPRDGQDFPAAMRASRPETRQPA
jgi:hypothetical protein